jgi:hypothetical protein
MVPHLTRVAPPIRVVTAATGVVAAAVGLAAAVVTVDPAEAAVRADSIRAGAIRTNRDRGVETTAV